MTDERKSNISKHIEDVLKHKDDALENAYTKSLEELVEDLKIYQYEIEFQNDELQRIQLELEQSRNKYLQLFENSPVGFVVVDDEINILDCNVTFRKMISGNFPIIECQGMMDFRKFIFADDQDKAYLFFAGLFRSKDFSETEIRLSTANGDLLYVQILGRYSPSETDHTILLSIKDITERKRVEENLHKSEARLQELNLTKDKFFSIISHDLRSPFNSILGLSELLIKHVRERDYTGIDQYAEMIFKSSQRTMDLLTNLLEWSRSQTGRIEYNPIHFELTDLMIENLHIFDDIANQKSITIKKAFCDNTLVFADKAMISTVLRNLLSNAIKFTRPGGEITVSVKNNQEEICVSVEDNGLGMTPDGLKKLFRMESSESTPGTNKEQGTGLGLLLCKEFIDKHAGKIWANSTSGKGSIFYFSLPMQ